jgi:hypothetical protein
VETPVLGITVRLESNSRFAMGVFEEAFVSRRTRPVTESETPERVIVRLVVREGDEGISGPGEHSPVSYRLPRRDRMLVHTRGSVGLADMDAGEAVAYVTPALAVDRAHFRYSIVEALTFALVSFRDRYPLHAAAIRRNGRAVLLAAPSGTGKSTLVYAVARQGWEVLAEDMVWLQGDPRLRVWGNPGPVRLPPDVQKHFSELSGRETTLLANGKRKIEVLLPVVVNATSPVAEDVVVCLLERARSVSLERLDPAEVERGLLGGLESGFDLFAADIAPRVRELARRGGWRLTLSDNPVEAVPLLEQILPP